MILRNIEMKVLRYNENLPSSRSLNKTMGTNTNLHVVLKICP